MNWEAIGAIGELAGAAGVIMSLLYLAVQIRRQNVESRLGSMNELIHQRNAFYGAVADNQGLATIWVKGIENFDALDPIERSRFIADVARTFMSTEGLLHQKLQGRLDQSMWSAVDRTTRDFCNCAGVKTFWSLRHHWYSDEFNAYISPYIDSDAEKDVFLDSYGMQA